MYLADTLSRAYLPTTACSPAEEEMERIHTVDFLHFRTPVGWDPVWNYSRLSTTVPFSSNIARLATLERSSTLRITPLLHCERWAYYTGWNPATLRLKIHAAHTGVEGCLRHVHETVYWPGMKADLWDYIAKCGLCSTYQKDQQKELLIWHNIPSRPWETVGCDIFHFENRDYLCTVDYYSSYFEINQLKEKTGKEVTGTLKRHFSTHGIPNKLQSDNCHPYSSHEFQQFMTSYDIGQVTSSLHYPQSNCKVGNAIKTAKNLLKKSKAAGTDFYLALLAWRNMPSKGLESSPGQRIFGRRTRILIPTTRELLKPTIV